LVTVTASIAITAVLATTAIVGYGAWEDYYSGTDMIVIVIGNGSFEGQAAGALRFGEVYMDSVSTMVANVRAKVGSNRIARLNILDHGSESSMNFGVDIVDPSTFFAYEHDFVQLRRLFAASGFVHLQGCSVGGNYDLPRKLANTLNVPVYAGTAEQLPVFRVNLGHYIRCEPSGNCTETARP
jgi:hypothetical protein